MTTCSEVRELLLEASPAEIRGEGEGALVEHLRECALCRRRAARLLEAEAALDTALGEAGALDVEAVLDRAAQAPVELTWRERAGSAARWVAGAHRLASVRRGLSGPRRWIPVAAAAAVAALLLVTQGPAPVPLPAVARAEAPPLVEASSSDGVAILETDNPNITVLWFFEQGT